MKTKTKRVVGMAAILSMTAFASTFAAQEGVTPLVTSKSTTAKHGSRKMHNETAAEIAEHENQMATDLASVLGLSKDVVLTDLKAGKTRADIIKASGKDEAMVTTQLQLLHETAMKTKLQAEVVAGTITQAKADSILATMKNHIGKKEGNGTMSHGKDEMITYVAQILGTTKEDIQSKMNTGKTPLDIVKASGMTEADFEIKMKALHMAEMKTKLQAEVVAGTITQAEMDTRLAKMAAHKEGMKGMRSFRNAKESNSSATTVSQ